MGVGLIVHIGLARGVQGKEVGARGARFLPNERG